MAEGLVGSAQAALANRKSKIDEAESKATAKAETPAVEAAESPGMKYDPGYSAAKAEARMKQLKASELDVKAGMPKPKTVMERLFGG